jgi:sugar O-acyltransferase (sialic acid O-acetyltransferase NeuD family)
MKNKLIIIGAGGHGKVVADIAIKMSDWRSVSFLDDNELIDSSIGIKVIGKIEDAANYKHEADFFVAIGNNAKRAVLLEDMLEQGFSMVSLIHPNSIIATDVKIDVGTAIMAGVVVNSSTKIGKGCILNTQCNVDHDNVIEDFVHISPGVNLAGTVFVGKASWIGIGSTVSNNVKIISGCIIGAGALVIQDIMEPGTYVGVPVQKIN